MIIIFLGFIFLIFSFFGGLILILPYFYLYAKAVDESCMIKKTGTKNLVEGDWLYKDVKIGKKTIKAKWDGLNRNEINLLKKSNKKVLVRQGIAFVPVFLIAFLILIYLWFNKINLGFCALG